MKPLVPRIVPQLGDTCTSTIILLFFHVASNNPVCNYLGIPRFFSRVRPVSPPPVHAFRVGVIWRNIGCSIPAAIAASRRKNLFTHAVLMALSATEDEHNKKIK